MHCVLLLAGVLLWQACFLHMTGCHDRMRLWVLLHRIAILLQATLGTVLCQSKSPGFWFTGKSDTMVGVTRNFLSSSRPKEFFYVLRRLLRPAGARGIICARALCCAHFAGERWRGSSAPYPCTRLVYGGCAGGGAGSGVAARARRVNRSRARSVCMRFWEFCQSAVDDPRNDFHKTTHLWSLGNYADSSRG